MTIYLYDEVTDKAYGLEELTTTEFIKAAKQLCKEADLRVWKILPPFKVEKPNILDKIRYRLLFRKGGIRNNGAKSIKFI